MKFLTVAALGLAPLGFNPFRGDKSFKARSTGRAVLAARAVLGVDHVTAANL